MNLDLNSTTQYNKAPGHDWLPMPNLRAASGEAVYSAAPLHFARFSLSCFFLICDLRCLQCLHKGASHPPEFVSVDQAQPFPFL